MSETDIQVSFQPGDLDIAMAREDYLPDIWVEAEVSAAEKAFSKAVKPGEPCSAAYAMFVLRFNPFYRDEEGEPVYVGPGLKNWTCLPIDREHWSTEYRAEDGTNPWADVSPEDAEKIIGKWKFNKARYFTAGSTELLASLGEVADIPRAGEDGLEYKGEVIGKDQYDNCKREAIQVGCQAVVDLWNNDTVDTLVGKTAFVKLGFDRKDPTRFGIQAVRYTAPEAPASSKASIYGVRV